MNPVQKIAFCRINFGKHCINSFFLSHWILYDSLNNSSRNANRVTFSWIDSLAPMFELGVRGHCGGQCFRQHTGSRSPTLSLPGHVIRTTYWTSLSLSFTFCKTERGLSLFYWVAVKTEQDPWSTATGITLLQATIVSHISTCLPASLATSCSCTDYSRDSS